MPVKVWMPISYRSNVLLFTIDKDSGFINKVLIRIPFIGIVNRKGLL